MFTTARQLFWFLSMSFLAMTLSLVVLGGLGVLEGAAAQVLVIATLVAWTAHAIALRRHRHEVQTDPRLHELRERRGF